MSSFYKLFFYFFNILTYVSSIDIDGIPEIGESLNILSDSDLTAAFMDSNQAQVLNIQEFILALRVYINQSRFAGKESGLCFRYSQ